MWLSIIYIKIHVAGSQLINCMLVPQNWTVSAARTAEKLLSTNEYTFSSTLFRSLLNQSVSQSSVVGVACGFFIPFASASPSPLCPFVKNEKGMKNKKRRRLKRDRPTYNNHHSSSSSNWASPYPFNHLPQLPLPLTHLPRTSASPKHRRNMTCSSRVRRFSLALLDYILERRNDIIIIGEIKTLKKV